MCSAALAHPHHGHLRRICRSRTINRHYKIRVEAKGFKTTERPNVVIEVASDVRADFALQPGQVSETIVVNVDIPLLNTTSSTLGGTLSNEEINDLPLNGRNYENLLQLRPGVMRYPGGGFSTTSANGLRAEDNAYYIEGLFNSEPYSGQAIVNGAGIAGDSATILPIDSIQEFNLLQSPPAEYGWKPGAVVNVGLKSGTNKVHGTAFIFGRDGAMDARNYFNADPSPKLPRTLEQFGGSFGGAIVKDKAFFFGAYEGQRYNVGNSYGGVTSPMTVPSTTPNGTCAFGFAGDCADSIPDVISDLESAANTSGIGVSPASLMVAGCASSGACEGTGFPTNNTQSIGISNGFNNVVHVNNFVAKVDYLLNERNSISGMYFFGNNTGTVEDFPELQQKWLSDIHTRAQVGGGSWISTINARTVNEFRFGYNRLYQPTLPGDLNTPASAYGLDTGVSGPYTGGLPRIGFGGYFFPGLGGFKWPKFQGPDEHVSIRRSPLVHGRQTRPQIRRRRPSRQRDQRRLRQFARQHHLPRRRIGRNIHAARRLFCRTAIQRNSGDWQIPRAIFTTGPSAGFSRTTGGLPRT